MDVLGVLSQNEECFKEFDQTFTVMDMGEGNIFVTLMD